MKKALSILLLLLPAVWISCSGSGAVSPLSPTNSSKVDPNSVSALDTDVVYWTNYPLTFAVTDPLNDVCLVTKKLGWACGNNGLVLKYDGDTWTRVDTGYAKTENLYAVAFSDENNGWITGSHGTVLHYQSGAWSQVDAQSTENLYGLSVTRSKTVWAVGSNGEVLTYNGISWGKVLVTDPSAGTTIRTDLYSIALSDQNNGWICGDRGTILRFDGQKWAPVTGPSTEKLNSVSIVNDVQAWIVGAYGTILRYNGTSWTRMGSAFSGFDLYKIYMRGDSDGWAVGQDGTLIYYDGNRFISHVKPQGKPALNSIAFNKDLGFIVGQNGTMMKFQPGGETAKLDFLFKGEVGSKPSKSDPFWTLNYSLMNQSPKPAPSVVFELPVPKGFEPYQKKATPTPTLGDGTPAAVQPPTATPTAASSTPGVPGAVPTRMGAQVQGNWTLKDGNLDWEIGSVSPSEMKNLTVMFQEKKNTKKEYPVVFKAVLKSADVVFREASPMTLLAGPPSVQPTAVSSPSADQPSTPTPAPSPAATKT